MSWELVNELAEANVRPACLCCEEWRVDVPDHLEAAALQNKRGTL